MNRDHWRKRLTQFKERQVKLYLVSAGWQQDAMIGELASVWHRPQAEESEAELLLPRNGYAKDYQDRLLDLLTALAEFERRDLEDVFQSLEYLALDLVAIQVAHDDVEGGTIPLNDGVLLNQRARDLMTSAALSTISKRRHFQGNRPPEAAEYLSRLRLGQTKVGSYVVNVLVPVGDHKSTLPDVQSTTFSQEVTSNLASALNAITRALGLYKESKDLAVFDLAVEKGASANMCDALAGFSGIARARSFSLTIEPAHQSPLADSGTFVYEFKPRDITVLIEAADYFRDNYVLLDRTIRGLVKRLDRVAQAEAGSVTITAPLVGGHDKNITVQLNEIDYIRTYAVRTQLARSSDFCDLSRRRTLALKAGQAPVSCNWTASFL